MRPGRDLERELRELGSHVEYPPTPDLARAVRRRLEEEGDGELTTRRGGLGLPAPSPRWAAAAALLLILAVPVLFPAARDALSGWFVAGQAAGGGGAAQSGGGGAGEAASQRTVAKASGGDATGPSTSEKPSQSGERASGGFMGSGPSFRSLDQMVATADLVVMGTVTDVRPGEVEAAGTLEPVRDLNAVVSVDEVLKGPAPEGPVVVKTLELAYAGPYAKEWRRPGERVLLFLSHSRETPGLYIVAAVSYDQTAYILRGDDLVATLRDPLSERVASLSLPELRREVEEAKARIARGGVKPLQLER